MGRKCLSIVYLPVSWFRTLLPAFLPLFQNLVVDRAEGNPLKVKVGVPNLSLAWFPKPYHFTQYPFRKVHYFLLQKMYGRQGEALLGDASYLFSLNSEKHFLRIVSLIHRTEWRLLVPGPLPPERSVLLWSRKILTWCSVLSAIYVAPGKPWIEARLIWVLSGILKKLNWWTQDLREFRIGAGYPYPTMDRLHPRISKSYSIAYIHADV